MTAGPTCLLVVGPHRSGTSALAGMLTLLGAEPGADLMPAAADVNDRGFFELAPIVACHEALLRSLDSSWDDPRPLPPDWWLLESVAPHRQRLIDILECTLPERSLYVVKDPRLCRLVPIWRQALATLGWRPAVLLATRDPEASTASLVRREGMDRENAELLFAVHALEAERETRGLPRRVVRYESLLEDWRHEATAITSELSFEWPERPGIDPAGADVDAFLSAELRHEGQRGGDVLSEAREAVALLGCLEHAEEGTESALDALMERLTVRLDGYTPPVRPSSSKLAPSEPSVTAPSSLQSAGNVRSLVDEIAAIGQRSGRLAMAAGRLLAAEGPTEFARRVSERLPGIPTPHSRDAFPDYAARLARERTPTLSLPNSDQPQVSIVIPAFNQLAHTLLCLEAVGETLPKDLEVEVIVSDDGSSEGAAELAAIQGLRVVRSEQNTGFVDACNRGAALARGEFLVFLNNDTVPQPGWLESLIKTFDQFPAAGLVGAKLLDEAGRLQEAGGVLWRDATGWNAGRGAHAAQPEFAFTRRVDYSSGACIAIRRRLFERLGRFNEAYRPGYYEDADLAFEVRRIGLEVLMQPRARVVHFEGASAGRDLGAGMKRHQVVNRKVFKERWKQTLEHHSAPPPHPGQAIDRLYGQYRRRILVLDARVPMPDRDAGSLRMRRILECLLAQSCAVTFIPFDGCYSDDYIDDLRGLGVEVHPPASGAALRRHLRWHGQTYQMVIASRFDIARKAVDDIERFCPNARFVFDTVDLHFVREARQRDLEGRAKTARDERRMHDELELIRRSAATVVVSESEQRTLLGLVPSADVRVVSTIHEPEPNAANWKDRWGASFVASFEHPPNADAIRWYLEQVHPLVLERSPDARLRIAGSAIPDWLANWRAPGVEVLGHVPDLALVLGRHRLSIAPLRFGAGVKGKINSSHAYGTPVVATPVGAEGMGLEHGDSVWLAADADSFADGVIRLHDDEALWRRISDGARRHLERKFSPFVARQSLEQLVQDLATKRSVSSDGC